MKINSIQQATSVNTQYESKVVVEKIKYDGDPETKKPTIIIVRMEETGEIFEAKTWSWDSLVLFKEALNKRVVCTMTFMTNEYKDQLDIKIKSFYLTSVESTIPREEATELDYQTLINDLINTVQNPEYRSILLDLIKGNYFIWPAAKSVHHAFPGGLAMHSYAVTMGALHQAEYYMSLGTLNCSMDLIITGALLHDIGKLREYTADGRFTLQGQMISHLVSGVEMVNDSCIKLGIDKDSDDIAKVKHIIVSHHGKLEFGSPTLPMIPEAYIVSLADIADAKVETFTEELSVMNEGDVSGPVFGLDGGRIAKI